MERLNLGKPFFPNERDNLLKDQGALPQSSSYPMVTSAVITPRQLAPTVGPATKAVLIKGEALRGMENLAIGEVRMDQHGNRIVDDSGWKEEADLLDTGRVIPFGRINVFVGMIHATQQIDDKVMCDSVSGAATIIQSDGEESVGTGGFEHQSDV